ncbi:MAG TPA: hypothetical protein VGD66_00685 [Allosphingosinicella sp.]|jgi:hypothetical protein
MQISRLSGYIGSLVMMLSGCTASTQLPVASVDIETPLSIDQILERTRKVSRCLSLDLRYGTSRQPYGTLLTVRMWGDGYELVLYNPMEQSKYNLSAYESPVGSGAADRAKGALERIRKALVLVADTARGCGA